MLFDDRLATVLRHRANSERAAGTQFRQLLDLLGRRQRGSDESLRAAAWLRLGALGESIPADARAEMIKDPALRFHSPQMAAHFAEDEPVVAAAALNVAQLREDDWEALIPRLPIRARGFLRFRDDLPPGAVRLLDQLGISDRGLPMPELQGAEPAQAAEPQTRAPGPASVNVPPIPANDAQDRDKPQRETAPGATRTGQSVPIGTLVERIEAFQRERGQRPVGEPSGGGTVTSDPFLPLGDEALGPPPLLGFAFTTDAVGRIDWAEPHVAPSAMHMAVLPLLPEPQRRAFARRVVIDGASIAINGAPIVSGTWICDAAPRFTREEGRFYGYAGRMRRPGAAERTAQETAASRQGDALRQLLHELRTPVNAIQGFAELIQQQLFGPVPHEYRALAANIAGDSARMLAGFDELDRLAKLESGALELDPGAADHSAVVRAIADRLETILGPRNAGFNVNVVDEITVALAQDELEALSWRMLASLAASLAPGEKVDLTLVGDTSTSWLEVTLPGALVASDDIFASSAGKSGRKVHGAATAGAFGPGFALRLARAEAKAAGGDLARVDTRLVLTLPRLTRSEAKPSPGTATGRAAQSS